MNKKYCEWKYRPGTNQSHWAYTPCKSGFNPLTRIENCDPYVGVADYYNNRECPICKRPIKIDYGVISK